MNQDSNTNVREVPRKTQIATAGQVNASSIRQDTVPFAAFAFNFLLLADDSKHIARHGPRFRRQLFTNSSIAVFPRATAASKAAMVTHLLVVNCCGIRSTPS
jgi:hypothetical protein